MDLHDYARLLRRSWILMTACTLLGITAGATASVLVKPTYTAETQLFVAIQGSGSVSELQQGNTFSQARVQSYVKTVRTPVVLQPVIESLGLESSAADLAERVSATADLNTVLVNISVSDTSAVQAAATARAIAASLVRAVDTLEKPEAGGNSPVRLSVVTPAEAPTIPSSPNTKLNLFLGLLGGTVTGIVLALVRHLADTRIRGEMDVRALTAAPILGGISFDSHAAKSPLLTQAPHQSPRAESFRQIRTNLQFANVSGRAKSVLITSSVPGEGKSTTATNLAIALAQAGSTVCLVDADLRRPMVHEYLGLDRNAGLTTALVGASDINSLLQQWGEDRLFVLTSGQIPPNPSEMLGSEEMKSLLTDLEQAFDVVIVDAPPLLPVTDAAVLSQHVGGVVVVVGTQRTKGQELTKSLLSLDMVQARILGVVLNRLPIKGPDAYAQSYYSYTADAIEETPAPIAHGDEYSVNMANNGQSEVAPGVPKSYSAQLSKFRPRR
ncbi:capsular exopolysaccharide synthesis family protein [Pseudarthrobacter oxydans]|uniref:non-specific protein-tyrosine kinase n=1 Tax=Pseudarthrobacter oxydans TaxID=1671 RepID=A0AAW8N6X9_PSEOX|nr:polysaccharide biosynthesis tyrosine autokinase [Pseudarthrobacter oxydans]MDR6790962.1 capsular exopolysaccharide synthesis family protein [Pseudarthrobacter oxydans]MDR7162609.1 capsular exopolysaccharide synthesis family protein [Pseudarthrobacter oxydans]